MTGYHYVQVEGQAKKREMLPELLKPLGYRSYHSGKWHVTGTYPAEDGGFDLSFSSENWDRFFTETKDYLDDKPLPEGGRKEGYYLTRDIGQRATGCLKEHQEQHEGAPFFMYLAFTSPHFPLQALDEDIAKYEGRFSHGWDVERERRQTKLKELGLLDVEYGKRDEEITANWSLSEEKLKETIHPGEKRFAVAWDSLTDEEKSYQATKMAIHCAMIDRMDQEIGRVVAQLKAMGSYEETLILFFSDNGATSGQMNRGDKNTVGAPLGSADSFLCLGPGWSTAANTPFHLHKHWTHEGGISTPLIAHWPEGLKAQGAIDATPGHVVDLLPTLLDLAGGEIPKGGQPGYRGVSLKALFMEGQAPERENLYWNHQKNLALRVGDWKIVKTPYMGKEWQLYDLANDRGETQNLAQEQPERVQKMKTEWERLTKQFKKDRDWK